MRTDEEVLARIAEIKAGGQFADFYGVIAGDLIETLPYDLAKPYLKDTTTPEKWAENYKPRSDESVKASLVDYMPFAWGKANDCRGLSAGRSINHMQAWLWLLGEDAAARAIDGYSLYGKPQLRAICEHYGIDWRALDDGHWRDDESDGGMTADTAPQVVLPWKAA